MATTIQTKLAYAAASANNISTVASPGAGAILINGSAVTAGVAILDAARRILFTSGTSDTGITFTVTGTNGAGNVITETITGGATTASTTQDFKTVTKITHTGSVAGTLTVGTSGVGSSSWFYVDRDVNPVNLEIAVTVTGTINYTVEYATEDPNAPFSGTFATAWALSALTSKAANTDAQITFPIFAIRITQNSFTNPGTASMMVLQSVGTPS